LAREIAPFVRGAAAVVFAVAPGGVPVGCEVARRLGANVEVVPVEPLRLPGEERLTLGAVTSGGICVLDEQVLEDHRIDPRVVQALCARAREDLARRERLYRGDRPPPDVRGKVAILVDDVLRPGPGTLATVRAVRRLSPARLIVAAPVATPAAADLEAEADDLVCVLAPTPLYAPEDSYDDLGPLTDLEARALVRRAERQDLARGAAP
jgi:predicted phosphoribosyltransferase